MNPLIILSMATGLVPTLAIAETSIRLDFASGILAIQEEAAEAAVANGGDLNTTSPTATAGGGPSAEQLAKAAQNPVADMISLPFQSNLTFPTGPRRQRTVGA